jgi:hypothetical protein
VTSLPVVTKSLPQIRGLIRAEAEKESAPDYWGPWVALDRPLDPRVRRCRGREIADPGDPIVYGANTSPEYQLEQVEFRQMVTLRSSAA